MAYFHFYDADPSSMRLCFFDCMCLPRFLRVTSTPHAHRHFLFKCTSFLCYTIKCSLLIFFPLIRGKYFHPYPYLQALKSIFLTDLRRI